MFRITGRDVAWGAAIASVAFAGGFFLIINSMVNATAGSFGTGAKVGKHVVQGMADTSYWLRTPSEIAQADARAVMLGIKK